MAQQEELFPAAVGDSRLVPVEGWPDFRPKAAPADPASAAQRVAEHLTAFAYRWTTERDLQDAIAGLLADSTFAVEREKPLDRRDRPDFLVQVDGRTVAVELKVKSSRNAVLRQLGRYAEHDSVDAIVFVAGRRTLVAGMPTVIHGKPISSVFVDSAVTV